jgi:hypothetical protein
MRAEVVHAGGCRRRRSGIRLGGPKYAAYEIEPGAPLTLS